MCRSQEEKLRSMPNVSMSFISGSSNYRLSALKYHENSASSTYFTITNIFRSSTVSEKDRETLSKLHDISFYIVLQRLPFTAFQNQVALEKLHGAKFTGAYENENACKNFIFGISEYLFEENVKKKLHLVNFIAILCDGSTDNSVIEQEVLYVIFTDPETFKPTMKFFEVVAPADSQDAPGLKNPILQHFINILFNLF